MEQRRCSCSNSSKHTFDGLLYGFEHHCPDSFWEWQLQTPWRLMGCKKLSCFALNLFKLNTWMRYRINNLSHVTSFYTRLWLDILTLWSERMVRVYCIVFHDGWTLTTEQSLKHLKVYFVLSFFVVHVTPLSTVSAGVRSFCVSGVFVCFLYESCKVANIYLLYKVSVFSLTIPFGFLSFFLHVFITGGANLHSFESCVS